MGNSALLALLIPVLMQGQSVRLQELYEKHHWFELRRALTTEKGSALYRGAVASAFDQAEEAERDLHAVIGADPHSKDAFEAHEWLAYLYMRAGRYSQVVAETDAKTRGSGRTEPEGERAFMDALRHFPDLKAGAHRTSRVRFSMEHGDLVIPLSVNGRPGHFIVDTDANFSIMSVAQARALGIQVVETGAKILGSTGAGAGFSMAVAKELRIGSTEIRDVGFLIEPDDSELFQGVPLGRRGLIGLPVLRSLGRLEWWTRGSQAGFMTVGGGSGRMAAEPNVAFDGGDPIIEVRFQGEALDGLLDTGNEETAFWPPLGRRFPTLLQSGTIGGQKVSGFGGSATMKSVNLPQINLTVGGDELRVAPAHVLLEKTTPNSDWFYGRFGIDLLSLASDVALDFHSMTLTLRR
jgi:hypothetical protein